MNAKTKKLFLILPKESESEQDLFKAFDSQISVQLENDTLFNFLFSDSNTARKYQEKYDNSNDIGKSNLIQAIKKMMKREKNLVIECLINLNNTEFFNKIKNSYKKDAEGISRYLMKILSSLESVLKEYQTIDKLDDFLYIIVACHLEARSKITYMDIQYKINKYLAEQTNMENVNLVYFSGMDETYNNRYIHDHKLFSAYSYEKLVKQKSNEQFKYFIELLEARAKGEEIKYFKQMITKRYINDLIKIFLPTAIDCEGIHQLVIRNQDITQYTKEAFDNLSLKDHLREIWINERGENTLSSLKSLSPDETKKLSTTIEVLRCTTDYEEFSNKFKDFVEEVSFVNESSIEII